MSSELRRIMKEIRLRRDDLMAKGEGRNNALNIARSEANKKYGKGWRERIFIKESASFGSTGKSVPDIYDEHINGEHWMD